MMSSKASALTAELRRVAIEGGASHFGVADVRRAHELWPDSFEESGLLPTGIAIAVHEDDALLDGLPMTDDRYRTSHYTEKIALAVALGDRMVARLKERGHRAHRLSHPPAIKATGLYKMVARLAGLGWIGKNRLLITPDAGPRVALAAVLTDALLPPTAQAPLPDGCGDCRLCLDVCPVKAFSPESFGETDSLEGFNTGLCATCRGVINPSGWGGCGLCMKVCPFGIQDGRRA